MDKWFENKFEKRNLRKYTKRRLGGKSFDNIFRRYSVTTILIAINIAVFIIASIFMVLYNVEVVYSILGIQAIGFFQGKVWTLITSMFMHGGLSHLFVNMFSLYFIGNFIEKLIGRKRFFWLYMFSGIFSGLIFVFFAYFFGGSVMGAKIFGSPEVLAVGASGAIFALGGLLAILTPKLKVYVFFVFPMKMWTAMIMLLVVLWAASVAAGLPFGNTAHFGGLIAGVGYGLYLKNKYKRKTKLIAKYFSG